MIGDRTPRGARGSSCDLGSLSADSADWNLQPHVLVLGQLFLLTCVAATLSIAGILFVVLGPVPVKRRVTILPRLSAPVATTAIPSLVAQLAPAHEQHFTPTQPVQTAPVATAVAPPTRKKAAKVEPLPRKRSARGTNAPSPLAPVVRSGYRQMRDEDVATNPVRLFESEELTLIDR